MRKFQLKLSTRLLLWVIFSVVSGIMMLGRGKFWRGIGTQFIAWGVIDGLIAVGGQVASDNRLENTPDEEMPDRLHKDKRNLRIALWVNTGLDVLYMIGGIRWMNSQREKDGHGGSGLGVLIQGAFLFFFDLYHAIQLEEVVEPADD